MQLFGKTDKGLRRPINEDSYALVQNQYSHVLGLVCDGIGGEAAGEVASQMAVESLRSQFEQAPDFKRDYEVQQWLNQALHKANDAIFYKASHSKKEKGMGTTAVGFIVTGEATYIFNVGDSRIYARYQEGLVQMSEDHNVVNRLLKTGQITQEQAKTHEQRSMLTNALGVWHIFQIDFHKIENDYRYLLVCSDGLSTYVAHEDIAAIVDQTWPLDQKVNALIARANQAGGYDNCTVILAQREEDDTWMA